MIRVEPLKRGFVSKVNSTPGKERKRKLKVSIRDRGVVGGERLRQRGGIGKDRRQKKSGENL